MQIRLNKPQSLTHKAVGRGNTIGLPWGRGVGKSKFLRLLVYEFMARYDGKARSEIIKTDGEGNIISAPYNLRGIRGALFMPSFKHCIDVHSKGFISELEGEWSFLGAHINRSRWVIEFPGGSWFQFFGAREANSARGIRADFVIVDECDDIDPYDVDAVIEPWFSEPWSLAFMAQGGTPRRGRHGLLYRAFKNGTTPDRQDCFAVHATYRDAPENVNVARIDRLGKSGDISPATFRREYLCDFDSAEGHVYPHFSEQFHVRPPKIGTVWNEVIIGIDHGWAHPAAMVVIGVLGKGRDAQVWVIDEFYESQARFGKKMAWLKSRWDMYREFPRTAWADPSQPEMIDQFNQGGVPVQAANNSVQAGIEAVGDLIAIREETDEVTGAVLRRWSRLYVSPVCKNLIREFGLYRRHPHPNHEDQFMEDPIKEDDDAIDALRYAVASRLSQTTSYARRSLPAHVLA